jgi:hypothetical protein
MSQVFKIEDALRKISKFKKEKHKKETSSQRVRFKRKNKHKN